MNKVELKHLLPKKLGVNNGVISLVANISGPIDNLEHKENLLIEHLKQEKDNKRESKVWKDKINIDNKDFLEFKKIEEKEVELFKQVQPMYSPFYKEKVNRYFYNLENKTQNK